MSVVRPRHISIFMPRKSDFYRGVLAQMRRGFELCGIETSGALELLGPDEMVSWCTTWRPDVVFEMNRARAEVPSLPANVRHVCWMVDLHARPVEEFQGSDITYLFANEWVQFYHNPGMHRWFGPGACDQAYAAATRDEQPSYDFGFAGHIPNPWSEDELARDLTGGAGGCTFGDVLPEVTGLLRGSRASAGDGPPARFLDLVDEMCRSRSGHGLVTDERLRYDLLARITRQLNRSDLLDGVLQCWRQRKVAIHGTENWSRWPRFMPHYRGWLQDPEQLRASYLACRLNLHEGVGIHFRSMDIMSSGGLLAFRERIVEHAPGGIAHEFEPHVHYAPFNLETIAADLEPYLLDPARAARVRRAAAAEIAARHTWRHRAEQVLADLAQL